MGYISDFVKNSDMMWKQSVWTSIIAAHLAAKHLKDGGALALTGAQPGLTATPGKISISFFVDFMNTLVSH